MNAITVYTKPACVQCKAVLRALDNAGINYDKVDLSTNSEARDYVMSLGYLFSLGFATVSVADQRIVGAPDVCGVRCGVRSPPSLVEVIQ